MATMHWPGDMVVGMRKVLAIPWCWYVCFSAEFSADKYNNTSKVTLALQAIAYCALNGNFFQADNNTLSGRLGRGHSREPWVKVCLRNLVQTDPR